MKSFLLIAVLLAATPAHARQLGADACPMIYNLAKRIMEMRQAGVSMPEAMTFPDDLADTDWVNLAKHLTREAYDVPRYADPADWDAAVSEFANTHAAHCYRIVAEG